MKKFLSYVISGAVALYPLSIFQAISTAYAEYFSSDVSFIQESKQSVTYTGKDSYTLSVGETMSFDNLFSTDEDYITSLETTNSGIVEITSGKTLGNSYNVSGTHLEIKAVSAGTAFVRFRVGTQTGLYFIENIEINVVEPVTTTTADPAFTTTTTTTAYIVSSMEEVDNLTYVASSVKNISVETKTITVNSNDTDWSECNDIKVVIDYYDIIEHEPPKMITYYWSDGRVECEYGVGADVEYTEYSLTYKLSDFYPQYEYSSPEEAFNDLLGTGYDKNDIEFNLKYSFPYVASYPHWGGKTYYDSYYVYKDTYSGTIPIKIAYNPPETTTTTVTTTTKTVTTTTTTTQQKMQIIPEVLKLNVGDENTLILFNAPSGDVQWVSDDTGVVKVTDGKLIAVSAGSATVYAVCGGEIASCSVTVYSSENTVIVKGDTNGDSRVTLADAVLILQYLANSEKYPLTQSQKQVADVDGLAGITGVDALTIQQYDAGIIKNL